MTVTRRCNKKDLAVMVDVSNGERLRYAVSFTGARAVFTLANKQGTILLSQQSPPGSTGPWELVWPGSPPPNAIPGEFTHALGMHFLAAATYTYKVTKEDQSGAELTVVKDCTYESQDAEDVFFDLVGVIDFVVGISRWDCPTRVRQQIGFDNVVDDITVLIEDEAGPGAILYRRSFTWIFVIVNIHRDEGVFRQ